MALPSKSLSSGSWDSPRIPESSRPGSPGSACALSTFSVVPGSVSALKRTKGFSSVGTFSLSITWVSFPNTDLRTGSNDGSSLTLVVMFAFRVGEPRFRWGSPLSAGALTGSDSNFSIGIFAL